MLLRVSYSDSEITRKINPTLGKPFSLSQRIKMWGNGSPKLIVHDASDAISELLNRDNNRNICNIELRPSGIIVGFRSNLESYYRNLVFSTTTHTYVVASKNDFMEISRKANAYSIHLFMKKLEQARQVYLSGIPK